MTQIGNNISKSGASILSRTALNIGETENLVMDQLEALQRREHRDTLDFSALQKRSCQLKEGKKKRANVTKMRKTKTIVTFVLQYCSKRKIGI